MKLEISPEDLAKVQRRKQIEADGKVNDVWLFLAEFGYYFGWEGIKAVREDKNFTMDEAVKLIKGARKVWSAKVYDHATASFIGSVSGQSKKPSQTFKKATTDLVKNSKADV